MVLRGLLLLSLLELRRWWALISVWDSHVGEVRGRVSGKRLGRMLVRLERLLWGKAGLVRRTGGDAGGTWRLRVLGMTLEVLRSRLLLKRRLRVILNLLGRTRWSGSRRKWASGVSWLERAHLARRVRDVANGWAGVAGWGAARREGERAWKSDGGLVQLSRELNEERVALLSHGLDVVIGEDVALPRLLRTRNEDIPEDRPPFVQQTLRCLNRWPFPFFLVDPGISRKRSRSVRPASFQHVVVAIGVKCAIALPVLGPGRLRWRHFLSVDDLRRDAGDGRAGAVKQPEVVGWRSCEIRRRESPSWETL